MTRARCRACGLARCLPLLPVAALFSVDELAGLAGPAARLVARAAGAVGVGKGARS